MATPSADALATIGLFADLDDASREIVAGWFEVEPAVPGQRLTLEGNHGYAFFVLDEGTAEVSVHGEAVRALNHGDYFGEIALLHGGRQTATVTVTSPSVVWTMFGTRYRELQREHPTIAGVIAQTAAERASVT